MTPRRNHNFRGTTRKQWRTAVVFHTHIPYNYARRPFPTYDTPCCGWRPYLSLNRCAVRPQLEVSHGATTRLPLLPWRVGVVTRQLLV